MVGGFHDFLDIMKIIAENAVVVLENIESTVKKYFDTYRLMAIYQSV